MKKLITLFALYPMFLFSQGPVDGYIKGKNQYSAGLSFSNEKAKTLFAGSDSTIASGRTTRAVSLFGIYGITNWLNVQVNIPYVSVNKGTEKSFQDASVYLKFALFKKDNKLGSLSALAATGFSFPLADYTTTGGSALGQKANTLDGRLIFQQNFNSKFFASVQGGYFLKSDPTPNAFSSSLKIGYAGSFYADVWYEVLQAFGGTDYRGTGDLAPTADRGLFRGLGFSYHKIGGTFYHSVTKHIGAFAGVSYILTGRNAFKNTGINLGIVFQ